jgi:hypothetical protein
MRFTVCGGVERLDIFSNTNDLLLLPRTLRGHSRKVADSLPDASALSLGGPLLRFKRRLVDVPAGALAVVVVGGEEEAEADAVAEVVIEVDDGLAPGAAGAGEGGVRVGSSRSAQAAPSMLSWTLPVSPFIPVSGAQAATRRYAPIIRFGTP